MAGLDPRGRLQHVVQTRAVALGHAAPRLFQRAVGQLQRRQQLARQAQVPQVDGDAGQPGRRQSRHAERDDLGVAFGPAQPRQLDARLAELALATSGAIQAHDRPLVAEANWLARVPVARRDETRDLRRDVRAATRPPAPSSARRSEPSPPARQRRAPAPAPLRTRRRASGPARSRPARTCARRCRRPAGGPPPPPARDRACRPAGATAPTSPARGSVTFLPRAVLKVLLDRVADDAVLEEADEHFRQLDRDLLLRFLGGRAQVRDGDQVLFGEQR